MLEEKDLLAISRLMDEKLKPINAKLDSCDQLPAPKGKKRLPRFAP